MSSTVRKIIVALIFCCLSGQAQAASVYIDSGTVFGNIGDSVSVTINYDFTDNPVFGGGFNVIYDPAVLEFESYTQPDYSGVGNPQVGVTSPVGELVAPGQYLNVGIGTFDFSGISTAGEIGTFVFTLIGVSGDAGCGLVICLTSVTNNPWITVNGQNITDELFPPVPVPAAAWLMLSGLGALVGFKKRQAR